MGNLNTRKDKGKLSMRSGSATLLSMECVHEQLISNGGHAQRPQQAHGGAGHQDG
jgi:hypothetical protein